MIFILKCHRFEQYIEYINSSIFTEVNRNMNGKILNIILYLYVN